MRIDRELVSADLAVGGREGYPKFVDTTKKASGTLPEFKAQITFLNILGGVWGKALLWS